MRFPAAGRGPRARPRGSSGGSARPRSRLGDVEVQARNLSTARGHFERSLRVTEALAAAEPTSASAQRALACSLRALGDVAVHAGDLAAARPHLDRALALLNPLVKATPDDSDASFQLTLVHLAFLDLAREERRPASRREHAEAAKALLDAMDVRGQVSGSKDREAAKERVANELAALVP